MTTYDGDPDGLSEDDLHRLFDDLGIGRPGHDGPAYDPSDDHELVAVKAASDIAPGDRVLVDGPDDDPVLVEVRGTWTEGTTVTVNGIAVGTGRPAQGRFESYSTVDVYA